MRLNRMEDDFAFDNFLMFEIGLFLNGEWEREKDDKVLEMYLQEYDLVVRFHPKRDAHSQNDT